MWASHIRLAMTEGNIAAESLPREPDLILFFGATDTLKAESVHSKLQDRFPAAHILGCSSGTMVDNTTFADDEIVAVAVGFDKTKIRVASRPLADSSESHDVGLAIGHELASDDLSGMYILSDGLRVNGSALVEGLIAAVGDQIALSGGLAGDGARFGETLVTIDGKCASGQVAAIGFYGSAIRIVHGSAGGWDEFGPSRRISRSSGSTLYELDGRPALELYQRYLGEEANALPASGLLYPLKIWDPAHPDEFVVRTLLAVDHDAHSLTFAGEIPTGWSAKLMRGSFDHLIDGAEVAVRTAYDKLGEDGLEPSLCLFVSCVGRRLLMGQRTEEEVEAVLSRLGGKPMIGFYSYGEIAPGNNSNVCGLHNQTVTLTMLAEAA